MMAKRRSHWFGSWTGPGPGSANSPLLDPEALDDYDPFDVDAQATHLFKHPYLGIDDVLDVWVCDPLFYPAQPAPRTG